MLSDAEAQRHYQENGTRGHITIFLVLPFVFSFRVGIPQLEAFAVSFRRDCGASSYDYFVFKYVVIDRYLIFNAQSTTEVISILSGRT